MSIIRNTQNPQSYIIARNSYEHYQPQATEQIAQTDLGSDQTKDGIEQLKKVSGRTPPPHFELYYQLVKKLNHSVVSTMKKRMIQGRKETLAEVFELGF